MHALRALVAGLCLAFGLVAIGAAPVSAEGLGCAKVNEKTGKCVVEVVTPPAAGDGGGDESSTPPVGHTGDTGPACEQDGKPIACTSRAGQWSNDLQCYVMRAEPQPNASDPLWEGHEPGDGAIYMCTTIVSDGGFDSSFLWMANPPAGQGPSPFEIAQGAISTLGLKAINIGITPHPVETNPDSMGVVGMPIYLWVAQPSATTYGPTGTSASAGGITVTLTASVERIEWVMGDGTTVTCTGANAKGTPYEARFDRRPSPTCGHMYERTSWSQPNHQYTVTARSFWRVDWQGAGQSGTIRIPALEETVHLRIGELQVLTQ